MKKSFLFCAMFVCMLAACGTDGGKKKTSLGFTGTFTDEFNNTFTLNNDNSAYIRLAGNEKVDTTSWAEHQLGDKKFATIEFNGDYTHFYICNGFLYRSENDMVNGTKRLKIFYQ